MRTQYLFNNSRFRAALPSAAAAAIALAAALPARAADAIVATGPRAVKIIFKQAYPHGSFDAPSSSGTVPQPGYGHKATRVFNPDGTLLSTSPSAANWPAWLGDVEIGVSGPSNTSATAPACARFASTAEAAATGCDFNRDTVGEACGASAGLFRVSDYDCKKGVAATGIKDGTGGPNDGIYVRAGFKRAGLGTAENVLAVFEYVAANYGSASSSPIDCVTGGAFTPENCAELTWKAFLKHNANETVQPFLMVVPPAQNSVRSSANASGVNPSTKQFYLPLASDPALSVLQISRIRSKLDETATAVQETCNLPNLLPANSPLCSGIVLYSLTLYRI